MKSYLTRYNEVARDLDTEIHEQYETWINGNRADCVIACANNAALAVGVAGMFRGPDRTEFVAALTSQYVDGIIDFNPGTPYGQCECGCERRKS